jgi:hypothetical protein
MTYATLYADIQAYAERGDEPFIAQIPRFIMLAENRIAAEARGLGFVQSVTDDLVIGSAGSALQKPARWRETVSLTIGTGTPPNYTTAPFNYRQRLKLRSYEYCRQYWPDASLNSTPLYYSDWTWERFFIAPCPDQTYPYELLYHERPVPLDDANQTNWTTQYAPQLILFASLLEASGWVKNADLIKSWQEQYDRALKQVEFESRQRIFDRSQSNPKQI